jgi:hypothetical protein
MKETIDMAKRLKKRIIAEKFRCRKCGISKIADDYYRSTEPDLDLNGKMALCKLCVKDITDGFIDSEKAMDKGILKTCRKLNVLFDKELCDRTVAKVQEIEQGGKATEMVFGFYLRFLFAKNADGKDLTFEELENEVGVQQETAIEEKIEIAPEMKQFEKDWGKGLTVDDYTYLEEELASWEATHRSDTKAEKTLLRLIAYKELQIRKARESDPIDPELERAFTKEIQDLMKTAAIDPSKANAASQGKGKESFSAFIKMIEETEPAEFYKEKGLFKDFDNIEFYFEKFITRPLKNFVMGSRDFNVETEKDGDDEDDSFDISDMGIEDDVPVTKEESPKKEE